MVSQHSFHWFPTALALNWASQYGCDYGHVQLLETLSSYSNSLLYHHGGHFYHSCNFPFLYLWNDLAGRFQSHFDTAAYHLQNADKYWWQVY
ncbi:hypothetical protein Lalb_Chr10g0100441 [Lupinus albus]|uniref:Uncharacterized protein n=1 Tax=Lupinus albus TaxID=3870 RepID=A0A6A4PW58_LUPAL|nr:hypothetical protein Lalb_Chr10g0100441 [Lupinus albus]